MISHNSLNKRFLKIGMDILTFKDQNCLVVVNYYSKYSQLLPFPDKTVSAIVEQFKSLFAHHGILVGIVGDNMLLLSNKFLTFSNAWGIKTATSSPTHSQNNGQNKRCVQAMKNVLKKAHEQKRDPYLAFLENRNLPNTGLKYSLAQILMSRCRRIKSSLAMSLSSRKIVDPCADVTMLQSRPK